jgi:hypothetical protein
MANVILPKNLSSEDKKSIEQPIDKDGWTNDRFDKLYGHKTKNPFRGTERDRHNKKATFGSLEVPDTLTCPTCGGSMFTYQEVCGSCYLKKND